jgi:hypothetical protein
VALLAGWYELLGDSTHRDGGSAGGRFGRALRLQRGRHRIEARKVPRNCRDVRRRLRRSQGAITPLWRSFAAKARSDASRYAGCCPARRARDGDAIAQRTGLGATRVGAILVAGGTSLPETSTGVAAIRQGQVDLGIGDLFGSNMANMAILALADLLTRQRRLLSEA